jgi:hypothetical protein
LTQTLPEAPASVTGVRRAYWRALRAHQVARERYEGLRAELDVAARNAGAGAGAGEGGVGVDGNGDGGELLALLRARERRRKLGAVERAVAAVEREGDGIVGAKIDDVMKKAVGDVPVLPSQRGLMSGGGGREEGEMRVVELKKAILRAKSTIDSSERQDSEEDRRGDGGSELHALQQARNELIGWIERQLALIGDSQAEEGNDAASSPVKNGSDEEDSHVATPEEILQLYDHYLVARNSLLDTVQQPQDISPLAPSPKSPKQARPAPDNDSATTTATALLPFVYPLLAAQSAEQALVHQAAYVRRQLSAAESSSERDLRRFADESHLVHPGASRGRDWARAGEEVGEATREYVLAKARAGEVGSREADAMLGRIEGITEGLERLVATQ